LVPKQVRHLSIANQLFAQQNGLTANVFIRVAKTFYQRRFSHSAQTIEHMERRKPGQCHARILHHISEQRRRRRIMHFEQQPGRGVAMPAVALASKATRS
jgi:hypothetical protein